MGWYSDQHPGHEGFLVGVVRELESSALWRELGRRDESERVLIERLAIGCDCGWRSPRFHLPFGVVASWVPFVVALAPKTDTEQNRNLIWRAQEGMRSVWWSHAEATKRVRIHDACSMLPDLVAGRSP